MAHPDLALVPVPFTIEQRCDFAGGFAEIRRYFCPAPMQLTVNGPAASLVLNMALSPRPAHTRVDRLEDRPLPLAGEAGRLLVMIPGEPYLLTLTPGSVRSLHCAFDAAWFAGIMGAPVDWASLGQFNGEAQSGLGIEAHLTRIGEELLGQRLGRERVIEACAMLAGVELARRFRRGRLARPDVYAGGLAAWRMRLIQERVRADGPAPRVTELARLCQLTERQLGRAFKAETGMTIGRYVDEATMERAHRLLTATDRPLAQIARELGYASAASFAQAWRRMTGSSPSRTRRL